MLRPIMAGILVTIERRGLVEVFPEAARKWWNKWQLRFLVVFSLILQIALIILGKLRKRNGKPWLRLSVWSAYLLADSIATLALGAISNRVQEHPYNNKHPNNTVPSDDDLLSFWAPFLLLHLGGPDTISAYSLEDNQLWQRRLLVLGAQTIVCLYILVIAWPGTSSLSILSIPMLIIGLIKMIERILSLRSASTEHFRLSLMKKPDPGPNYSKFMDELTLKKAEGFYVKAIEVIDTPLPTPASTSVKDEELVLKASKLFKTFKHLFVDLILSFQDRNDSQCFFHSLKDECEKAFEVIEIELGFAYDVFYTKAPVVYNPKGYIIRLVTFVGTASLLVVFHFISKKDHFQKIDLFITYLLLGVAIILEICSYLILSVSDWPDYHYKKNIISCFRHFCWAPSRRWSNLIAQYSIQNFCREEKSTIIPRILNFFLADKRVNETWYLTYAEVSSDLKKMIFDYFLKISICGEKSEFTALCTSRGNRALENSRCRDLDWSISEVEFDQSILLWHIATDLCYHLETKKKSESTEETEYNSERAESKRMSDYMMYLLVMCPFMLPMGIGMIRFRDTCAEVQEFFKERIEDLDEACKMLLRVNTEISPGKVKGDRSKSVLFDACRLAKGLRSKASKWQIISRVWVEILAFAACHCRGNQHAQQLRKGGEFLTHVWLLMAHLGITEQFQISQGHARAKLSAK